MQQTPNQIADAVTKKYPGASAGCCLTVSFEDDYYVMWTAPLCAANTHRLLVSATNQARLEAHWQGFIENHAKAPLN